MPLQDQLFSQIISGVAPINPGVGGWDVLISQFFDDRRGRHGFGLQARILNLAPSSSPGSILIAAPLGWSSLPLFVGVNRTDGGGISFGNYQYQVRGAGGTPATWRTSSTSPNLVTGQMMIHWPKPSIFETTETDVPYVNGDDPDKNTFTVARTAGGSDAVDFFVYGFAWQNND